MFWKIAKKEFSSGPDYKKERLDINYMQIFYLCGS